MFDFSPAGILTALALSLWTSLSSVTVAAIGSAFVLMVVAHRTGTPRVRAALLGLAAALGLFGLLWQGAAAEGARKMQAHDHAIALAAEKARRELAEADARAIAEQATQDLAEAQADNARLKDLTDALSHDPRGAHPAVPREWARRLRAL